MSIRMKIAVQLYSIRDHIASGEDLLQILAQVKAMGYDGVEFAGYQGLDAAVLKARLEEVGLAAVGTHIGTQQLTAEEIDATLDYHQALGCMDVGVGGASHETPEETAASCVILQYANEKAIQRGMRVYYHNHTKEFIPYADGSLAIDSFFAACFMEIDTYWSFVADVDNYRYLKQHADKIIHLHLKDGADCQSRPLGQGDNDLPVVVKAAKEMGLEWLIVENEGSGDTLSELQECIDYLKSIL